MKYIYGPVPSRRLGRSLGIDPIPSKTCNYQCIYCQLGRTNIFTNERSSYIPKEEIMTEMKDAIRANEDKYDYITFVGSGEPTLCLDLKELILEAKHLSISERSSCFKEVESVLSEDQAVKEAKRCLRCELETEDGKQFIKELKEGIKVKGLV